MIVEFPYIGVIKRFEETILPNGDVEETENVIYDERMDCTLQTPEVGQVAQTSNYVVSIPLDKDMILPRKNDVVEVTMYGETITLTINNAIPSQLGGVTIYASRGVWE